MSQLDLNGPAIFLLAAAPITLLTGLSKSSAGKAVQQALEQKLPQLQADAAAMRDGWRTAAQQSPWCGLELC